MVDANIWLQRTLPLWRSEAHSSRASDDMSTVPVWFERRFEFTFPVELFPNLCARLRGTPARLEDLFRDRPSHIVIARPGETQWSAQEHAGHLLDLEPLWLSRVEDYLARNEQLTPADLQNRKTHEANHNSRSLADILSEFRAARQEMLSKIERSGPTLSANAIPHPRLKTPMRLVDHLYFVAEHDDHHLARIWELISSG